MSSYRDEVIRDDLDMLRTLLLENHMNFRSSVLAIIFLLFLYLFVKAGQWSAIQKFLVSLFVF